MAEAPTYADSISEFEKKYDYNATYLRDMLETAPQVFEVFMSCKRMTSFREHLPAEAYYVAAVSVMEIEDCGPCYDLNLKMAREEGVSEAVLKQLVEVPGELPAILQDIRAHAQAVAERIPPDEAGAARIRQHFGDAAFAELALCIAGVRIYPALKRALMRGGQCSLRARRTAKSS